MSATSRPGVPQTTAVRLGALSVRLLLLTDGGVKLCLAVVCSPSVRDILSRRWSMTANTA